MNARRLLVPLLVIAAFVPASSANASFPGVSGRIVFTSDRAGSSTSDIYSAAADGTDVQRLTFTADFEQEPAWSPDGSRIAYESSYQGRLRVFVMNQDGTGQHLVSPDAASSVDDMQPAWSPDGTQIAFASTRGLAGGWHVWVMNADGTNLRELPGDLTQHPAWSPDGSRIAGDAGGSAIFVINADGTNERRLATPPASHNDEAPDWSPDGATVVFSESPWDGTSSALYAVGADGSGERQLTSGAYSDYDPSWSPDGTRIVFVRRTTFTGYLQIYTIGAGGGNATPLLTSGRNDLGPNWGSGTSSPVVSGSPHVLIVSPSARIYLPGTTDPVYYICSSDVSFVVSCNGSQPLFAPVDTSFPGTHHLSVTATDVEGRQTTATVTYTVFDITPPTITFRTPSDGATFEVGERATVDFACSDGATGSGIQYCAATQPNGTPVDTSHAGTFTFQVIALDGWNNFATATATYRVVDSAPPSITIKTPADGGTYGLGDNVTVSYTCTDGSGVQSCTGTSPSGAQLDTGHLGSFAFQVYAIDNAGNSATATTTFRVVDRTPPSIVLRTPASGATYTQDQILTADYSCADQPGGSGLVSCVGDLAPGALIDTAGVGNRTFTVTATDGAQNAATASSTYRVIYDFSGFFQPVAAFPTANPVKAGAGIPLKFSLHGYRGSAVFALGSPVWTPCNSSSGPTVATGTLAYNQSLDRYTFLAATDKSWAGTCSDLTVTLRDGTAHQARFTFGK